MKVAPVASVAGLVTFETVSPRTPGSVCETVSRVRAMTAGRDIDIEVDGGVTADNAAQVVQAGANVLVAGSAVFKGGNYKANIAAIRNAGLSARGEAA